MILDALCHEAPNSRGGFSQKLTTVLPWSSLTRARAEVFIATFTFRMLQANRSVVFNFIDTIQVRLHSFEDVTSNNFMPHFTTFGFVVICSNR